MVVAERKMSCSSGLSDKLMSIQGVIWCTSCVCEPFPLLNKIIFTYQRKTREYKQRLCFSGLRLDGDIPQLVTDSIVSKILRCRNILCIFYVERIKSPICLPPICYFGISVWLLPILHFLVPFPFFILSCIFLGPFYFVIWPSYMRIFCAYLFCHP